MLAIKVMLYFIADDQIQRKLQGLRNSYTRELRQVNESKKSGAGADDVKKSSWPFYDYMHFLRPVIVITTKIASNMVSLKRQSESNSVFTRHETIETALVQQCKNSLSIHCVFFWHPLHCCFLCIRVACRFSR